MSHCLKPIKHQNIFNLFVEQQDVLWKQNEAIYTNTQNQWNKLTKEKQHIFKYVLALFAQLDNIICDIIPSSIVTENPFEESKMFYAIQCYIETVHALVYSDMITECIIDANERDKICNSIINFPSIKNIVDWLKKQMQQDNYLIKIISLIGFEGIIFMGGFVLILWFKDNNEMPEICNINSWILRDENYHVIHNVIVYNTMSSLYNNALEYEVVLNIMKQSVDFGKVWIDDTFGSYLHIPMFLELSKKIHNYMKCMADDLLHKLKYPRYYNIGDHDCYWMHKNLTYTKTNFFDQKVTDYTSAGINNKEIQFLDEF